MSLFQVGRGYGLDQPTWTHLPWCSAALWWCVALQRPFNQSFYCKWHRSAFQVMLHRPGSGQSGKQWGSQPYRNWLVGSVSLVLSCSVQLFGVLFMFLNSLDHISNHLLLLLGVTTTSTSSTVVSAEGLEAYSLMIWTLPPRRKYSSL